MLSYKIHFFKLKYLGQIQIVKFFSPPHACKKVVVYGKQIATIVLFSGQSSLSIFTQKYLRKCEDTHFNLQNRYLRIYENIFVVMILAQYIISMIYEFRDRIRK